MNPLPYKKKKTTEIDVSGVPANATEVWFAIREWSL